MHYMQTMSKWCKREELGISELQSRLQRQQQLSNSWYMRCVMGSLKAVLEQTNGHIGW